MQFIRDGWAYLIKGCIFISRSINVADFRISLHQRRFKLRIYPVDYFRVHQYEFTVNWIWILMFRNLMDDKVAPVPDFSWHGSIRDTCWCCITHWLVKRSSSTHFKASLNRYGIKLIIMQRSLSCCPFLIQSIPWNQVSCITLAFQLGPINYSLLLQ